MVFSKIIAKYSKIVDKTVCVCTFDCPIGILAAAADNDSVYLVSFVDSKNFEKMFDSLCNELSCSLIERKNDILCELEHELSAYFEGKLRKFTIPVKTIGSEFQKAVWKELQQLPYASTKTYGELSKALGRPASHARAVGAACGANAHILVIPCHRLVASGTKGGFSCGLDRKEWLIEHEKKYGT